MFQSLKHFFTFVKIIYQKGCINHNVSIIATNKINK